MKYALAVITISVFLVLVSIAVEMINKPSDLYVTIGICLILLAIFQLLVSLKFIKSK